MPGPEYVGRWPASGHPERDRRAGPGSVGAAVRRRGGGVRLGGPAGRRRTRRPGRRRAGHRPQARQRYARAGHPVADPAFAAGEVLALDGGSPCSRCVRGGGPVIFGETNGRVLERAGHRDGTGATGVTGIMPGYSSFLAVPMTAGQMVTGFLLFARRPAARRSLPVMPGRWRPWQCGRGLHRQRLPGDRPATGRRGQRQRLIPAVPRSPGRDRGSRPLPARTRPGEQRRLVRHSPPCPAGGPG